MPDADYHALREQVEAILVESRHERALADDAGRLRTYWQIGDALLRHLERHPDLSLRQQTVSNLSKDTRLGQTLLYETARFRRFLPAFYARENLSWSHYRALLRLPDPEQFHYYEQLAAAGAWTTRQLKQAIDTDCGGQLPSAGSDRPAAPLRARFGELSTYRVVADPLRPGGPPALDFGFHHVWVPTGLPGFDAAHPGDTVTLRPVPGGDTRAEVRADRPAPWTYVARVQRLVDGDTLTAVVDLGLGHRAFPRLRLRGLDAPEVYTQAGRRAREFVAAALAAADFAVIATRTTDSYGRYLADLKYLPGASPQEVLAHGTYLNRQLLDQGLAVRYDP